MSPVNVGFFSRELLGRALRDSVVRLQPLRQLRNPVMFVTWVGAALTTLLWLSSLRHAGSDPRWFVAAVAAWLWFTVWFANLSESLAEGRGRAHAAALRRTRRALRAKRLASPQRDAGVTQIEAAALQTGDHVLVEAGDSIPSDGEVVVGIASLDESAVTGESAPVIRESGGDRSAVTGGTLVLSDWLVVRITSEPGHGFLERMISLVEGAKRQKTPNEIALTLFLAAMSIIFLLACATLLPFSAYAVHAAGTGTVVSMTALIALLVCLIPTTIGGLLSAIGIAGMGRLHRANVIALSGRAVEAAGDVDVLLLDKTGTITFGNRQAASFIPAAGSTLAELAAAAQLGSLGDETPEGRSIVILAKGICGPAPALQTGAATVVAFSAQTRMSGLDWNGQQVRKGAVAAVVRWVDERRGAALDRESLSAIEACSRQGATPLLVAQAGSAGAAGGARILGVIVLKDVVKGGIKERFGELRRMGIRTVMITGDNPRTAAAIAAEAGVDEFRAEVTPEQKLAIVKEYQHGGRLVAMTGDGTNDAPALAQADVAVAMNTGTQAAKEAGNMVDLDSSPTKLIEIVAIGKQLLMTRGALTTFSLANDVAKYFAIIPAIFVTTYPVLGVVNVMHLHSPQSAILSAVIFNALIIVALIPLALRGVPYRAVGAAVLLRDHLLIYGVGGLIAPFIGIKLIDLLLTGCGV